MVEGLFQDDGQQLFTGGELLLKGALETTGGVHMFSGVAEAPLASFFDALARIAAPLVEHRQIVRIARDGPSAMGIAGGAQLAGCRSLVALGPTALSAAGVALAQAVQTGSQGDAGMVILCADDPWQAGASHLIDVRFIAEQAQLPLLEPAEPQEVKDWIAHAFELGRAAGCPIGVRMTSALAEGGGTVRCRANQYPQRDRHAHAGPRPTQETVSTTIERDAVASALQAAARRLRLNRMVNAPIKGEIAPLGFIACGAVYAYLAHALAQLDLQRRLPILKLGLTYPIDAALVTNLARQCRRIIVIEEGRNFVERQVGQVLGPLKLAGEELAEVHGKRFPKGHAAAGIPSDGPLHPSILIDRLVPMLRDHPTILASSLGQGGQNRLLLELERTARMLDVQVPSHRREPTFCAGCPQRDTAGTLLELREDLSDPQYMLAKHKRKPVSVLCHGDAGCSSLLQYEPNRALVPVGVGQGISAAAGAAPFIESKQIVFMGDGTFFQSGQNVIGQAIAAGNDVTYVIQANKTVALVEIGMADGGMGRVGSHASAAPQIQRLVEAMISKPQRSTARVVRIDPEDRYRYRNLLEQMVLAEGVKIIIADKACGITKQRQVEAERRRNEVDYGYPLRQTFMNIDPEICDNCGQCVLLTGCPGLTSVQTEFGKRIQIDQSSCVNDRACQRITLCPAFEQVTVERHRPRPTADEQVDTAQLAEPPRPIHADQETWRCFIAGVGGMGVGVATSILAAAGQSMGYSVQFIREKGQAVRTASTSSQMVFTRREHDADNGTTTASIPYGTCDLLIGLDLLEAVNAIDPQQRYRVASPERTAILVNAAAIPAVGHLLGLDDLDETALSTALGRYSQRGAYVPFHCAELCQRVFGSKRYVNVMLLGLACQKGLVPLRLEALEQAVAKVTAGDAERNLHAFALGRSAAIDRQRFEPVSTRGKADIAAVYQNKVAALQQRSGGRRGHATARRFRRLVCQTRRKMGAAGRERTLMAAAISAIYDCWGWGGAAYAKRYCRRIVRVAQCEQPDRNFQLTRAAVKNLAKVMLIKDEIYVAALLSSKQKRLRDQQLFNVDVQAGDQLFYRWAHRPEFELFGRRISFEWNSRLWQLRLLARQGWLRRVIPRWHQREHQFRLWYERLIDQIDLAPGKSAQAYARWVAILQTPEQVSGFREVAYPKMIAARRQAEQLLAIDPNAYEPAAFETQRDVDYAAVRD